MSKIDNTHKAFGFNSFNFGIANCETKFSVANYELLIIKVLAKNPTKINSI